MTPKPRLITFDIGHIALMDLSGNHVDEMFSMPNGIENLETAAADGDAFTLMYDGRVMCVGGVHNIWPGCGQVWLIPSVYALQHPMVFARQVRRILDVMIETHQLHRVQALINTKLAPGERWIEMLGFTKEGVLRKYSPQGNDYFMYGRVQA